MTSVVALRLAIEALPVHEITGYEWECYEHDTGCHYHGSPPLDCGHPATSQGTYDRDGVACNHDALLDRARVLALFEETP